MEFERHEEEAFVDKSTELAGTLGIRKIVERERVEDAVPREIEEARFERAPAREGDSGEIETLPDGSISIPVFEERVVVTKETVVRERVIVQKDVVTQRERVQATVRKERVELETSGDVELEEA